MNDDQCEQELEELLFAIDNNPGDRLKLLQDYCRKAGNPRDRHVRMLWYRIATSRGEMRKEERSININISGSVGNFNLGEQLGDIEAAATQLRSGDNSRMQLADALESLSKGVAADQALPPENKREAIESLKEISEHASTNGSRLTAGVRAMLNRLPALLAMAEDGTQLWHEYGSLITKFFGL